MGKTISTLKDIVIIIKESCEVLGKLDAKLAAPGLKILSKLRAFLLFIPWYVYAALAVGVFIYFLPTILKMLADWISSLRSASADLREAWSEGSESDSPDSESAERVSQLEKVIEDLQAGFNRMENMLKDYQDYAVKNNILPMGSSNVRFLLSS